MKYSNDLYFAAFVALLGSLAYGTTLEDLHHGARLRHSQSRLPGRPCIPMRPDLGNMTQLVVLMIFRLPTWGPQHTTGCRGL